MLKIRLRRMGSRHRPFYRVVVSDSRRVPTAAALEVVGYYDPRKKPVTLKLDIDRVDHWMSNGAQPSKVVKKLVDQARVSASEAPAVAEAAGPAPAEEASKSEKSAPEAAAAEVEAEAAAETSADDSAETSAAEVAEATEAEPEAASDDEAKKEADSA